MSEKMMKKSRVLIAALLGIVMIAGLTMWSCGDSGTSSYDDPSATTTQSDAVITAEILNQWIGEGKLNAALGGRDRVVVVSVSSAADWTGKGHIPGAVRMDTAEIDTGNIGRIEGLALATRMMPDGPMMDGIIQRLGIDANTTIVITIPKNSSINNQSVAFWDYRYWGFARERLKILNGGDDAWDVAGLTLATDATEAYTASTYSVSNNASLKDVVRYSIGEIIARVDSLIATPALKDEWQMIETLGLTHTPYLTNALRSVATQFLTRLDAGDGVTRNYVYPDKATLEARMASIAVDDGGATAYVSPTKKTICMCGTSTSASPTFVLFDAVLNVPEGNIIMYDGSYTAQWSNYSLARLTAQWPNASAAQLSAWAFDNATAPRAQGAMATAAVPSIWAVAAPVLGPSDPAMNQIEEADKDYMAPATTTTGGATGGGGGGGGC